jgi:urease accessory protein
MFTLTQRLPPDTDAVVSHVLRLTADERTRSRHRFVTTDGIEVQLVLARGTLLRDGDLLRANEDGTLVRVQARPEPVLTVRAVDTFALTRAAYHLGNRHVALELGMDYLRLGPDPVLADMLVQLGLVVIEEVVPFQPEAGAYGGHGHSHGAAHAPFRRHP